MKNLAVAITIGAAFKGVSAFGSAIKNTQKLKEKIDELNEKRVNLANKFNESNKAAIRLNNTINKLKRNLKGINVSLNISKEMDNFRKEFRSNFLDKVAVATTIVAPFKVGIDFENEIAKVKALSGATGEEFKKLQEVAKKLGSTTVFSASEAARGMQFLAMAGFKTNQIIKAMPGLLDLAAASATDLATTADITSNILSGFGISADKTTHVADVLAKAMTTANVDVRMLGETMKYVAPAASGLGASLEEVTALAAKLGDVGIQGSEAGTALRSMYARLASPPSEAKKVITQLGLQIKDANGNFIGMFKVLEQLQQKTKHLSNTQKATILKDLFGMEAMSAGAALLKLPIEKLREYEKALINADGTAKKIAKTQNDTVAGSFKALGSALEGLSISFSTLFLPFLKEVTDGITTLSKKLNSFIENHKTLASVIGGVVAGFIGFSLVLSGVGYAASFVVSGVMKFFNGILIFSNAINLLKANILTSNAKIITLRNAILSTATAQKVLNFVMSLNPFAKFLLFITFVIGGLTILYNKFSWFKDGVNAIWRFIKEIFSGFAVFIEGVFSNGIEAIKSFFVSPISFIANVFTSLINFIKKGWDATFGWISNKIKQISSLANRVKSFFGFGDNKEELNIKKEEKKEIKIPKFSVPNVATVNVPVVSAREAITQKQIHSTTTNIQNSSIQNSSNSINSNHNYTININVSGANPNEIIDKIKVILPHLIEEIEENRRERALNDTM